MPPNAEGPGPATEPPRREHRPGEGAGAHDGVVDLAGAALRDDFVDAFNARDLDGVLALCHQDVECPDLPGDGAAVLAEELAAIWERSPGAVLTPALLDDAPCAVAWLPDEEGCWSKAAVVCVEVERDRLAVVTVPDDADALDRAETGEPIGDELDAWIDWAEWDRGEETLTGRRAADGDAPDHSTVDHGRRRDHGSPWGPAGE